MTSAAHAIITQARQELAARYTARGWNSGGWSATALLECELAEQRFDEAKDRAGWLGVDEMLRGRRIGR